jgi:hypothetical protein
VRNHGPIPKWGKRFVTQSHAHWVVVALSPGVKWPVCEAHHPYLSSGEVKNDRTYISTSTEISQGMHRDNFVYLVGCALHCSSDVSGTAVRAFHFI